MHLIAFNNEMEYKKVEDFINENNIKCTSSISSCRAIALEEARTVVENNLINYPKLYYDENFDVEGFINEIADEIEEYDTPYDNMYSYASEIFEKGVKNILEEDNA